MKKEVFINYWLGQETNPPSPTLDQMPAYVDIVPLGSVGINSDLSLDFSVLTQNFSAQTIQGWIQTVQANGTKVLLSISSHLLGDMPEASITTFVQNVTAAVQSWGVNGLDLDYGEPQTGNNLVAVVQALRTAMPEAIFTAPVSYSWIFHPNLLKGLTSLVNYICTTGGGSEAAHQAVEYAMIIGGVDKLVLGMSCRSDQSPDFTPINSVEVIAAFAPKGGCMLNSFSYDVTTRTNGGTGYANGLWTKMTHECMPKTLPVS